MDQANGFFKAVCPVFLIRYGEFLKDCEIFGRNGEINCEEIGKMDEKGARN